MQTLYILLVFLVIGTLANRSSNAEQKFSELEKNIKTRERSLKNAFMTRVQTETQMFNLKSGDEVNYAKKSGKNEETKKKIEECVKFNQVDFLLKLSNITVEATFCVKEAAKEALQGLDDMKKTLLNPSNENNADNVAQQKIEGANKIKEKFWDVSAECTMTHQTNMRDLGEIHDLNIRLCTLIK